MGTGTGKRNRNRKWELELATRTSFEAASRTFSRMRKWELQVRLRIRNWDLIESLELRDAVTQSPELGAGWELGTRNPDLGTDRRSALGFVDPQVPERTDSSVGATARDGMRQHS